MIANFFKQSKPIVFLFLGMLLSLFYFLQIALNKSQAFSWKNLGLVTLNYAFLLVTFIIFELAVKRFEIQRGHRFISLFFVLFVSFLIPDFQFSNVFYAFFLINLAMFKLLNLAKAKLVTQSIFESVFLIGLATFFYKPAVVFLLLVLVATLVFTTSKWRYFIVPVFSISSFVIITQMFYLYSYDKIADYEVFIPGLRTDFNFINNDFTLLLLAFWLVIALTCAYQIFKVKQIRSLYHKQMASLFLAFLGLALISFGFKTSSVPGLWLMSLWPFCIYLGDFILRLKKKIWFQILFWVFVIIPVLIYLTRLFEIKNLALS